MTRAINDQLRLAMVEFVEQHPEIAKSRFKNAISAWRDPAATDLRGDKDRRVGSDCADRYVEVEARDANATSQLRTLSTQTGPGTRMLFEMFHRHHTALHWKQSYTEADAVVGRDMLEGYAFAEIIGKQGPWKSERVRAGIGIWGPHIDYPVHRHRAEEIYVVLAGAAAFGLAASAHRDEPFMSIDENQYQTVEAGGVVPVHSMQAHGFRTDSFETSANTVRLFWGECLPRIQYVFCALAESSVKLQF